MTHHVAVGEERAKPARREDCGCGRRGGGGSERPFTGGVQLRSSSLPSWSNARAVAVRMPADADRRVSVTIALARQVRDWLSPSARGKFEQCSRPNSFDASLLCYTGLFVLIANCLQNDSRFVN